MVILKLKLHESSRLLTQLEEIKLRVIAGLARGSRLKAPKGMQLRPTADRVKEALFSILGARVPDAYFIDLYAGSGAIGIEALSRGARFSIFVDNQRESIRLINENLAKTGFLEKARVAYGDVFKIVEQLALEEVRADLIFLDPPYNVQDPAPLINVIFSKGLLKEQGLVVVEHAASNLSWVEGYALVKQKRYGDSCLTFIQEAGK